MNFGKRFRRLLATSMLLIAIRVRAEPADCDAVKNDALLLELCRMQGTRVRKEQVHERKAGADAILTHELETLADSGGVIDFGQLVQFAESPMLTNPYAYGPGPKCGYRPTSFVFRIHIIRSKIDDVAMVRSRPDSCRTLGVHWASKLKDAKLTISNNAPEIIDFYFSLTTKIALP